MASLSPRTRSVRATCLRWSFCLTLLLFLGLPLAPLAGAADGDATVRVRDAIDGDTLILEDGRKVRYLGVNSTERGEPFYEQASEVNRRLVRGRQVHLEFGPTPRDRFGRLLAYVYVGQELVNARLLREGWVYLFVLEPPLKYYEQFLGLQQQAKRQGQGIWGRGGLRGPLKIATLHADAEGDDRLNLNGEYVRVVNIGDAPLDLAGYRLSNRRGSRYTFPASLPVSLRPGYTALVLSGRGRDRLDPESRVVLHWGAERPIWNNSGDTAYLRDPGGRLIDTFEYRGKGRGD